MTRTIVAILALSPVLLHAQANSPAQPSSTPVLQSSLSQPVALAAIHGISAAAPAPAPVRITTGVTPPVCIHQASLDLNSGFPRAFNSERTVVVDMIVDETGKPSNVAITKSSDLITNARVVEAVSQYRYTPATLDGSAVAVPMTIHYTIK